VPEVPVHLSVVGYRVEWMSLECTALMVTVSVGSDTHGHVTSGTD